MDVPNLFHRGYHLGFSEDRKSNTTVEFRWGWVTPETTANGSQNGESVSIDNLNRAYALPDGLKRPACWREGRQQAHRDLPTQMSRVSRRW